MFQNWDIAGTFLPTYLPGFFHRYIPFFSKGTLKERPRLPTYLGFFMFQNWDIAGTFLPTYLPGFFHRYIPFFSKGTLKKCSRLPTYLGFFMFPKMGHCPM